MSAVPAEAPIFGSTMARVYTPPLLTGQVGPCGCGCALDWDTSYGFHVAAFADAISMPLDPWQRWLVIHAGEMLPLEPGAKVRRPRFRTVLVLIARQQGKTHLGVVLTLYWLFVEAQRKVGGTSTNRDVARESWKAAVVAAQASPILSEKMIKPRFANGTEALETLEGCRYLIAASTRKGLRGHTINRLVLDELREHLTFEAVDSAVPTMNAVPDAQAWALTNQGGEESVVLRAWHSAALSYISTGSGDRRLGLFEWSAPRGAAPTDPQALASANPSLGYRTDMDTLMGQAMRAEAAGGAELASFRTEIMCQEVDKMDPAVDPDAWTACLTETPLDLTGEHRRRVALCLEVSLNGDHASLVAAALVDGVTHLDVVAKWSGQYATAELRRELPGIVARVRPAVIGWFPAGPTAAITAELTTRRGAAPWPPRGVKAEEIRSEVTATSMGFAELAKSRTLRHVGDPLLDAHVAAAQRTHRGDAWIFGRRVSNTPIDALYAAAGAAHLARTMKPPRPALTAL